MATQWNTGSNVVGSDWLNRMGNATATAQAGNNAALSSFQGTQQKLLADQNQNQAGAESRSTDLRARFTELGNTIQTLYATLIKENKAAQAYALADATARFARSGSQMGVNSWAQSQAISNLQRQMQASASGLTSQLVSQQVTAMAANLRDIGSLDINTFNQALQSSQFGAALNQGGIEAALKTGSMNFEQAFNLGKAGMQAEQWTAAKNQDQSQFDQRLAQDQNQFDRQMAERKRLTSTPVDTIVQPTTWGNIGSAGLTRFNAASAAEVGQGSGGVGASSGTGAYERSRAQLLTNTGRSNVASASTPARTSGWAPVQVYGPTQAKRPAAVLGV